MVRRVKDNGNPTRPRTPAERKENLATMQRVVSDLLSRTSLAYRMGKQYSGARDIYKALGYPQEQELDFEYYLARYERQDIASAIIDRPVDETWNGELAIMEPDVKAEDSKLLLAWNTLNEELSVKQQLNKADKLAGIGEFALLLFGFNDITNVDGFEKPAVGSNLKLKYIKAVSQGVVAINEWETRSGNERYGKPKYYLITVGEPGRKGMTKQLKVHWTRVLHITEGSLTSDIYGRPRLKPIVNRLVDLEKLLGGDAEMFWRGARPGYTATPQEGFEMGEEERTQLEDEMDMFEHDLRRIFAAKGVDIEAMAQQVADPIGHIDVQLQAISAQTGFPKRILVGSERGELSSAQDKGQWLKLIKTRMEEYAELILLRPFIDICMERGVLPKYDDYNVMWEDLFAPSEEEKAKVGEIRAKALKVYADSVLASEIMPPSMAAKYLIGLNEEQIEEVLLAVAEQVKEEDAQAATADEEEIIEEEVNQTE